MNKCEDHQWEAYGYGKRTDKPTEKTTYYECKKCKSRSSAKEYIGDNLP